MRCIACGKANMVRETRDLTYTYKGHTTTIKEVSGDFCPACDESLHQSEEAARLSSAMLAFNKEVNGASVDPAFIIKTRKQLRLDQQEAAEIFGGGSNAFSRYETGKTKPPLALVQLLKILNKHPELLDEIRPAKATQTMPASVKRNPLTTKKRLRKA